MCQSNEVDAIFWSDAKVSKHKSLLSNIHIFFFELFFELFYFLLVLVLLKFHHSKLHTCKQP